MEPVYTDRELEFLAAWPNCVTPDCEHKSCRIMESVYCSPCSARVAGVSLAQWSEMIDERRRALGLPVKE